MTQALASYVRNTPYFFHIPATPPEEDILPTLKNAQFHLKLDDIEDADIIEYLSHIRKYYRNSFLKNLLRGYLAGPAAYTYEEEMDMKTEQKMEIIQDSILHISDLGKMKKRKKRKSENL